MTNNKNEAMQSDDTDPRRRLAELNQQFLGHAQRSEVARVWADIDSQIRLGENWLLAYQANLVRTYFNRTILLGRHLERPRVLIVRRWYCP